MQNENQETLSSEKIGKLMQAYALPCVISLLVGALYNIVDQLFFGLDGVLYSMPVSDVLTFCISMAIIVKTYRELREEGTPIVKQTA